MDAVAGATGTTDVDLRRALRAALAVRHAAEPDTLIIDELGIRQGAVRVDLAVVNGALHGYEIKSDRDTLARLASQAEAYGTAFDFLTIVTTARHLPAVTAALPGWWGVMVASDIDGRLALTAIRRPKRNPAIDPRAVAELLWRDEALSLLESTGLGRRLRRQPRARIWDALVHGLPRRTLLDAVRETLKRRTGWRES